jgi:hypothetical protein
VQAAPTVIPLIGSDLWDLLLDDEETASVLTAVNTDGKL